MIDSLLFKALQALLLSAVWGCFQLGAAWAQPVTSLSELESEIQQLLQEGNVPGASVIVIEDYAISFRQSFGVADRVSSAPVTEHTVFRAGSISKSFTSIGIMMLVEEGKLALDAPLRELLPDVQFRNQWEKSHPVQLRHLLEHTAGFNDIAYRHYLISGANLTVGDAVELYRPYRSRWRPGTRTSYTNAGPVIAGLIIEKVSGQSFEDFMQDRLFDPLELSDSAWTKTPSVESRLSSSYQFDGVTPEPFIEIPGRPSGSLNTTAEDLAILPMLMLGRGTFAGRTYFSPEVAAGIEMPETNDAARAGLALGYALGNNANLNGRTTFFGHDGSIDGFAATARYSPELGAGYVVMINSTSPALTAVSGAIREYLEGSVEPPEIEAVALAADASNRWAGQYQTLTPRRDFLVPLLGLTQWQGVSFDDGELRFKGQNWIHLGNSIFQSEEQSGPGLVFLDDEQGIRLQTGESTYRRVSSIEMWTKIFCIAVTLILVGLGAVFALIWIPSQMLGRLKERGGVLTRSLPTISLLLAVGAGILPVVLFGSGNFEILGKPSIWGWLVFALTIISPILSLYAAYTLYRGSTPRLVLGLGVAQVFFAMLISSYLSYYGWFALRIWDA